MVERKRGGQPANENATKRPPWSSEYNLDTAAGIAAYMKQLIKLTHTGIISAHTADTIVRALNLLSNVTLSEELDTRLDALEEADKQRKQLEVKRQDGA